MAGNKRGRGEEKSWGCLCNDCTKVVAWCKNPLKTWNFWLLLCEKIQEEIESVCMKTSSVLLQQFTKKMQQVFVWLSCACEYGCVFALTSLTSLTPVLLIKITIVKRVCGEL